MIGGTATMIRTCPAVKRTGPTSKPNVPTPIAAEQRDYVLAVRAASGARAKLTTYAEALGRLLPGTVPLAESLRVPLEQPSVLRTVTRVKTGFRGRLTGEAANQPKMKRSATTTSASLSARRAPYDEIRRQLVAPARCLADAPRDRRAGQRLVAS